MTLRDLSLAYDSFLEPQHPIVRYLFLNLVVAVVFLALYTLTPLGAMTGHMRIVTLLTPFTGLFMAHHGGSFKKQEWKASVGGNIILAWAIPALVYLLLRPFHQPAHPWAGMVAIACCIPLGQEARFLNRTL